MNYKYVSNETLQYIDQLLFELDHVVVDGNYSGKHRSILIGRSLDFVQHREYVPGDDLKFIDWKVYARRDRFFIKQHQQETNLIVSIYLDCSPSMWYPSNEMSKYEYGSYIVSYLSYILLHQGDSVSVAKFSNVVHDKLEHSSQRNFYYKILSFLENEIYGEYTNFDYLVDYIFKFVKKRTVVIIISDFISNDETKLVKLFQQISVYGIYIILLHIVDKRESNLLLEYEDNCIIEYIEDKNVFVKTNIQEIQKLYKKEFDKLIEHYTQSLNGKNIRYIFIDTSLPIITNLRYILQV